MAERILPPPDVFSTCPSDGKILEYYSGTFEAGLVMLHPFIKSISIGIEPFAPTTYIQTVRQLFNTALQFRGQKLPPRQGFRLSQPSTSDFAR